MPQNTKTLAEMLAPQKYSISESDVESAKKEERERRRQTLAMMARMLYATTCLCGYVLACTPGHPDTLVGDTSSETSTGTEETGDGDPGEETADEETDVSTEGGETGPGDGDPTGDGDPGEPVACWLTDSDCEISWTGDPCTEGGPIECAPPVTICTEPAGLCMVVYNGVCPPGWVDFCE